MESGIRWSSDREGKKGGIERWKIKDFKIKEGIKLKRREWAESRKEGAERG